MLPHEMTPTQSPEIAPDLPSQLVQLCFAAKDERFEDGYESDFSRQLVELLRQHSDETLAWLTTAILSDQINPEVAAEALRWVGNVPYPFSRLERRRLLERCLLHSTSARIRDGALLGLASLDDPASVQTVKRAIAQETLPELRADLEQLLQQLEETQAAEQA